MAHGMTVLTDFQVIGIITRILLTYAGEIFGSLAWMGVVAQLWCLPFLIYMNVVNLSETNKWIVWSVLTLFLGFPNGRQIAVEEAEFIWVKNTDVKSNSSCSPSWMGIPQFEQRANSGYCGCDIQHVCTTICHHSFEHISGL